MHLPSSRKISTSSTLKFILYTVFSIFFGLGFVFTIFIFKPAIFAKETRSGQEVKEAKECLNGGNDYLHFLNTRVSDVGSTFQAGSDLFKNACQLKDILTQEDQLRKVRDQLRNAYLKCDTVSIDQYQKDFFRLKLEQDYVRSFVECEEGSICFFERGKKQLVNKDDPLDPIPHQTFQDLFQEKYVNELGWFTGSEFTDIFDEIRLSYNDRLKSDGTGIYQECNVGNWSEIGTKLREVWGKISLMFPNPLQGFQEAASSEIERQEAIREQHKARRSESLSNLGSGLNRLREAPLGTVSGALNKSVNVTVSGIEPAKNLSAIKELFSGDSEDSEGILGNLSEAAKNFYKNTSSYHSLNIPPTVDVFQEVQFAEDESYTARFDKAEMLIQYYTLYGRGTDDIISALSQNLDTLRQIIDNSILPMQSISECKEKIFQRQCVNKGS